jgi:hypothetical protein
VRSFLELLFFSFERGLKLTLSPGSSKRKAIAARTKEISITISRDFDAGQELFSREQYLAAAEAFMRGVERRMEAGLNAHVGSVTSVFVSRWDAAIAGKVPAEFNNQLGIAVANRTYKAYRDLLGSPRWQRAFSAGARPQRLLWASTGTKDPQASDVLYVKALAAPYTVNTMPEATLKGWLITANLARSWRLTAAIVKKSLRNSPRPASMLTCWPASFKMRARSRLSNRGMI